MLVRSFSKALTFLLTSGNVSIVYNGRVNLPVINSRSYLVILPYCLPGDNRESSQVLLLYSVLEQSYWMRISVWTWYRHNEQKQNVIFGFDSHMKG